MVDSNRRDSIDTTIRSFSATVKYSRMASSSFLHSTQLFSDSTDDNLARYSGRLRPGSKSFMIFMYIFQKLRLKTSTWDDFW